MILSAVSFTCNAKVLPTVNWWLLMSYFIICLNLSRACPKQLLSTYQRALYQLSRKMGHPSTATYLWKLPRKQGFVLQLRRRCQQRGDYLSNPRQKLGLQNKYGSFLRIWFSQNSSTGAQLWGRVVKSTTAPSVLLLHKQQGDSYDLVWFS